MKARNCGTVSWWFIVHSQLTDDATMGATTGLCRQSQKETSWLGQGRRCWRRSPAHSPTRGRVPGGTGLMTQVEHWPLICCESLFKCQWTSAGGCGRSLTRGVLSYTFLSFSTCNLYSLLLAWRTARLNNSATSVLWNGLARLCTLQVALTLLVKI